MQINLIDDSSVSAAPAGFTAAIAVAAQFLDSLITSPITVNILVGWGEDDNGTYPIGGALSLGGALAGIGQNYSQMRNDLIASASTAADIFAVASLPINDPTNGETFFVSDAEAQAFGLLPANNAATEGAVGFSSSAPWNFNTDGQAVPSEIDLVGVAEAELAHALGMELGNGTTDFTAMMLYRYSSPGVRELTVNGFLTPPAYFSIDGGKSDLGNYDATIGDSTLWNPSTAGHDAFANAPQLGAENVFSLADATELNILGFNVDTSVLEKNGIIQGTSGNDTVFSSELPAGAAFDGAGGTNTLEFLDITTPGIVAIVQGGAGTVNKGGTNGVQQLTNVQNLVGSSTGSDVFYVDAGETVHGGSGFEYLIELSTGVNLAYGTNFTGINEFVSNTGDNTVNFASGTRFAYLFGATGNDTLTVGAAGGYLFGEGGTNVLNGGANTANFFEGGSGGTDTMNGGTGGATNFYFVDGNDQVNGAGAFNTIIELVSAVTVQLGSATYQHVQEFVANGGTNAVTVAGTDADFTYLYGGAGNDTLATGSGGGYLIGAGGTNTLTGGGGTNVFIADGASGVDTMNGGTGSNLYYIDANSIVHGAGTFNNVIELQQNASLVLGSAQLGTNVQQVIFNGGTNSADFHTATSSVYLYGASGNDTLFGGAGDDFLYGAAGVNLFRFAAGWGQDTIMDWTSGTNNQIDLSGLAGSGVHAITDITQTIAGGKDVITSGLTGTNSITLLGVGSALTASSFHFT